MLGVVRMHEKFENLCGLVDRQPVGLAINCFKRIEVAHHMAVVCPIGTHRHHSPKVSVT